MSDKSVFASTATKAGTDARPPPPSPAKIRARLAMLDVRYVLEILLIDPDLIEEQIVGKQVNHVFQLTALDVEEDPLPGITEANVPFVGFSNGTNGSVVSSLITSYLSGGGGSRILTWKSCVR